MPDEIELKKASKLLLFAGSLLPLPALSKLEAKSEKDTFFRHAHLYVPINDHPESVPCETYALAQRNKKWSIAMIMRD